MCLIICFYWQRGCHGHDHMVVGCTVQSLPIATNLVRLNPADGEVYSLQHYVINFVRIIYKMKNEKYHIVRTVHKLIRLKNCRNRVNLIHDRSIY